MIGTDAANDAPGEPSLRAALTEPHTYRYAIAGWKHLLGADIRIIETHISLIALVGEIAFKIKKPVKLPFLDYSSLERRQVACLAELALNQRWAPTLYLGLSRMVQSVDGVAFDTDGSVIEYAVRMRRFDRRDELEFLIQNHAVSTAELSEFGVSLARSHLSAAVLGDGAPEPDVAIRQVNEAVNSLRTLNPSRLIEDVAAWVRSAAPAVTTDLERRRRSGRVRECHGDLHCSNIVRIDDHLTAFDGIEFSNELRCIDVASDTAFLLMDLQAHGRDDLAVAFLSAWLDASADYDSVTVLRFFLVYRALVRGQIHALRGIQLPISNSSEWRARVAQYVRQSLRYIRVCPGGIVLMHGYSGSGKSTVAKALMTRLPAVLLRSDVVRRSVLRPDKSDEQRYSEANMDAVYRALAFFTRALIGIGFNVIVDATFLHIVHRREFIALAGSLAAPVAIVSCKAPPEVLRQRIQQRSGGASEATIGVLESQLAEGAELDQLERSRAVVVDTDAFPDTETVMVQLKAALTVPGGVLD